MTTPTLDYDTDVDVLMNDDLGTLTQTPATPTRPDSAITQLLFSYAKNPAKCQVPTFREYLVRMQQIPRLSTQETPINGFAPPVDLSQSALRLSSGLISSRLQRAQFQKQIDLPISVAREMLLLCFEAKPRPLSYSLSGYTASDFFSYIYQDVALREMENLSEQEKDLPFIDLVNDIKAWMRIPPPVSATNTARRHIRRRIMAMLDRSNHQASSLMEDREMPSEILMLIQKLLERDDDMGYTRGDIRDYRQVRSDLNALAAFCIHKRFDSDSRQRKDLELVVCPSLVVDFSQYPIQQQRGRPPVKQGTTKTTKRTKEATSKAVKKIESKHEKMLQKLKELTL